VRPVFYVVMMSRTGVEGRFTMGEEDQSPEEFAESYYEDPWVLSVHLLTRIDPPGRDGA
jgi:hypothetical protein